MKIEDIIIIKKKRRKKIVSTRMPGTKEEREEKNDKKPEVRRGWTVPQLCVKFGAFATPPSTVFVGDGGNDVVEVFRLRKKKEKASVCVVMAVSCAASLFTYASSMRYGAVSPLRHPKRRIVLVDF